MKFGERERERERERGGGRETERQTDRQHTRGLTCKPMNQIKTMNDRKFDIIPPDCRRTHGTSC